MVLLNFMLNEGQANRVRIVASATLASVGSLALLLVVNLAAEKITRQGEDHVDAVLAVVFVLAALVYYWAEKDLIRQISTAMENAIDRVRLRLINGVRRADYEAIEKIGSATLYESITQASNALSQNSQFVALSVRSALLTLLTLMYILYLSVAAFVLVLLGTAAAGIMYYRLGGQLAQKYAVMMGREQALFGTVEDLLDGFREVRLSSTRSRALGAYFEAISAEATRVRTDVQSQSFQKLVFGHVAFFFLLAVVVFLMPLYTVPGAVDVVKVSASVIFMIGPLGGVIQAVTVMASADAAARGMLLLDARLQTMTEPGLELPGESVPAEFDCIRVHNTVYSYPVAPGESAFTVGPHALSLRRGEVLFITGGNGSGKSSFIKVLTGLYRPAHGSIDVDGLQITDRNRRSYRELFAAVFSDHQLTRRLYGLNNLDSAEVRQLLELLEIGHLVSVEREQLSRIDFSTGQRKRVLLLAALLEHRPVLVLDEWAADQDPYFRAKFYREILPFIQARGTTVVAVTHDDHYFDAADRRIHFEQGLATEVTPAVVS